MRESRIEHESVPVLVRTAGLHAGTRYQLTEPVTRIGRAAENDIAVAGPEAMVVSGRHAEIRKDGDGWRICDLQSTNGTFVNGDRISEADLVPGCTIQLGAGGPELVFTTGAAAEEPADTGRTIMVSESLDSGTPGSALGTEHDLLLRQAIVRARAARRAGALNQTGVIMRDAFASAIRHSRRRLRQSVAALVMVLISVTAYSAWRIDRLNSSKRTIDIQIAALEKQLAGASRAQADKLISELDRYQAQGRALEENPLYRFGARRHQDVLASEIRTLLAEFGAEVYSIPPDFLEAVRRQIGDYRGPDRPNMERALHKARPEISSIRRILGERNLPPDFAYMVLVESAMDDNGKSSAGAAGLWQITPATARELGLHVGEDGDERLSTVKSTIAACKYIRQLILDFGTGTSVMLALAAYNSGPWKVKQAIRRVADPIKQRNFWYLYRIHALPEETREYVPRVIAAMIIGRNPASYGF